jgi:hypothetical protein
VQQILSSELWLWRNRATKRFYLHSAAMIFVRRCQTYLGPIGAFRLPGRVAVQALEDGLTLLPSSRSGASRGVVSKRRDAPYRSGECRDWRKVKTATWRQASRHRWRVFE